MVKLEQLRYNTSICKTVSSIFKSYMLLHHAEAVLGVKQIQIKVNIKIIRKKGAEYFIMLMNLLTFHRECCSLIGYLTTILATQQCMVVD